MRTPFLDQQRRDFDRRNCHLFIPDGLFARFSREGTVVLQTLIVFFKKFFKKSKKLFLPEKTRPRSGRKTATTDLAADRDRQRYKHAISDRGRLSFRRCLCKNRRGFDAGNADIDVKFSTLCF